MNPISTAPPVFDLKATDSMILMGLLGIMLFILSLAYGAVYVKGSLTAHPQPTQLVSNL